MDTGGFVLRPRTEADLVRLVDALRLVAAADDYPGRWPDDPVTWLRTTDVEAAWVAAVGGELLGQVVLRRARTQSTVRLWCAATGESPDACCVVSRFFVVPPARGVGVGRALLAEVTAAAAERGRRPLLDVARASGQAAIRLYHGLGWTQFATFEEAWFGGGELEVMHCFAGPLGT